MTKQSRRHRRCPCHPLIARFRCLQLSGTGYAAAAELWPDVFSSISGERQAELMAGMRVARARLVSGFESMVMVRGPWARPHLPVIKTRRAFAMLLERLCWTPQLSLPCVRILHVCTHTRKQRHTVHLRIGVPSC